MAGSDYAPPELKGAAAFLAFLLSSCQVLPDGKVIETRQQVARIRGVSIHIYSNEHAPPHFHVKCAEESAKYTIESCDRLEGGLGTREERIVQYWFKQKGKAVLIEAWNRTRPGGCSVGRYGDATNV
jgi:uncharacterized protein DUF4160